MEELQRENERLVAICESQEREIEEMNARTQEIRAATALRRAELAQLREERARREMQARRDDATAAPAAAVSGHLNTNVNAKEGESAETIEKEAADRDAQKDVVNEAVDKHSTY